MGFSSLNEKGGCTLKTSYFLRGSGGQGVQVAGTMLLYAMNEKGYYATFFPEYGANKRGGFSQCALMASDQPVYSFTDSKFDVVVALNEDSYEKFGMAVNKGGTLIVNSGLVKEATVPEGVRLLSIPFDEISRELGDQKVMNTLVFGFLVRYMELLPLETAREIMLKNSGAREAFRQMNLMALDAGFREAEVALKQGQ